MAKLWRFRRSLIILVVVAIVDFVGRLALKFQMVKRPENFIFVRDQGCLGSIYDRRAYRDLKHYAESAGIPETDQEAAARSAGFEAANRIGPYLRTMIRSHHDTLAVGVR